jgi:hypothetical protein
MAVRVILGGFEDFGYLWRIYFSDLGSVGA